MQAGFSEIDITPPLGTLKIGWLKCIVSDEILAPLFARVAILTHAGKKVAFVQLDTLFIAWPEVVAIRQGVEQSYGFPGANVMVSATHNHAGPAVTHAGDVPKDETYAKSLVVKVIDAFGTALDRMQDAEIGFNHVFEWNVAYNRRVVMRDGVVRTHGTFDDPDALYIEGPVDPEVAVLAVRSISHDLLGVLVNFACHPTHLGGDGRLHPGFPGVLASLLRDQGCPFTLFLNGPSGNLHTSNPAEGGKGMSVNEAGTQLAVDVKQALDGMDYEIDVALAVGAETLDLPYRQVSKKELKGEIRGAQRFVDPAIYDRIIPSMMEKARVRGTHRAEIQVIGVGEVAFVAVPGEYFVEFGLCIKEQASPVQTLVVSCANGRVGYIPTKRAFTKGGYETTFGPSSMLDPEAGDCIADAALRIIKVIWG